MFAKRARRAFTKILSPRRRTFTFLSIASDSRFDSIQFDWNPRLLMLRRANLEDNTRSVKKVSLKQLRIFYRMVIFICISRFECFSFVDKISVYVREEACCFYRTRRQDKYFQRTIQMYDKRYANIRYCHIKSSILSDILSVRCVPS